MKIGVDIGGSHIAIGVLNKQNKIVEMTTKKLSSIEKAKLKLVIEEFLISVIARYKEKYGQMEKIGIAIPGIIDNNLIIRSVNLGIEKKYDLAQVLNKEFKEEIQIINDTKSACIAEYKLGSLVGCDNSIFLTLGTGIGAKVIIDGKILNKQTEVGHIIIKKDGIKCNCQKNGCFEKYCSMKAFKTNIRNVLNLSNKVHGNEIYEIIKNNMQNPKIKKIITEFIQTLAIELANLVNIFESTTISIGGSFVYFAPILLPLLNDYINSNNLIFNKQKIEVKAAILGNDAGLIGSCL